MALTELALTESPALRAQYADRVDALDKVKALRLLPDDMHATTELVATYYEVDRKTIEKLVERNRAELEQNGLRIAAGAERRQVFDLTGVDPRRAPQIALFPRRAVLNVGQLLKEAAVSRAVHHAIATRDSGDGR